MLFGNTLGQTIPGNIAVIGYDGIPLAALPTYDLTTYRQPISAVSKELINVLRSDHEPSGDTFVTGKFIVRRTA